MFKNINKVIKTLILSDIILLTGIGFMSPIFAIFIANNIYGGDIRIAGFAASIYWITLSIVLIPFGKYLDKKHGEKEELYFIVFGNILISFAVFGYVFANLIWHIYLLQIIYAIGMGMNIPGYTTIFTKYIDKEKIAFSWSTRAALVGVGVGTAGSLGGLVVHHFGFPVLFIGIGIFVLFSACLPLLIRKNLALNDNHN